MYYIIYKTTNLINGKFYIGKHQCTNLNDNYLGSGVALCKSIIKYGRENFKREILFIFDSEQEMNQKEKELVTIDLVNDDNCYNLTVGGEGGPAHLGHQHSEETKAKLREIAKTHPKHKRTDAQKLKAKESRYALFNGKWFSDEIIEKIRQSKIIYYKDHPRKSKKKIKPKKSKEEINQQISNKLMGHIVSDTTRKKLSDKNKGKKPSNAGKVQMNDGNKNIYILPNELDKYLGNGWVRGRYQNRK